MGEIRVALAASRPGLRHARWSWLTHPRVRSLAAASCGGRGRQGQQRPAGFAK